MRCGHFRCLPTGRRRLAAAVESDPRFGAGRCLGRDGRAGEAAEAVDLGEQTMHIVCMATKTISVRLEAYERLRRARRFAGESFSEIILRADWPAQTLTAGELLERYHRHGPFLTEPGLVEVEELKRKDGPPADKRANR